jgi:ribose transport system substrate-binding protein
MQLFQAKTTVVVIAVLATLVTVTACSSTSSDQPSAESGSSAAAQPSADLPTLDDLYKGLEGTPPSDGPAAATGKKVFLVSCGEAFPPCSIMGEEMAKAADVLGWDFKVLDGAGNVGGAYGNAIRQAVAADADAVILNGFDCSIVKQPLEEAKAAGVLVLGLEAFDCSETGDGDSLFTAPMQYLEGQPGAVAYWEAFGTMAAEYIASKRPDAKIIAVSTFDDGLGTVVYDAFETTLEKNCPDCEIVEKVSGVVTDAFPGGPLEQRFSTALVQHPDVTAVYSLWDTNLTNLNGGKAVTDAGLRDQTLLVGGLGTEASIGALRDGKIDAIPHTVDKAWLAWGALDQLNRAFAEEPPAGGVGGPRVLDETQDLPSSGGYVTDVDYVDAYTAIWTG